MLSWLLGKIRGEPPKTAAPSTARSTTQQIAKPREKPRDDSLWELFRNQRGAFEPLTDEDEALVVARVLQVVEYVCEAKLDPPAMPALAPRILDVLSKPDVDVPKLVRVLEQDQSICAKLLSMSNSAVFGPQKEITSLRDAIVYMGVEQTAHIAIGFASKSLFDSEGRAELSMYRGRWARLFGHGMTTAFAAGAMAAQKFKRNSDEAFLGGLFHDVGKVVALRAISALSLSGTWEPPPDALLDEVLYRIHAVPGAEFYDRWTLPSHLMQICCDHHQHENAEDAPLNFYLVTFISSLDALRAGSHADKRYALDELRTSAQKLGLSDQEIRVAYNELEQFAARVSRMFTR
jgi:putative nucleotidyltransferase with HDIG domain